MAVPQYFAVCARQSSRPTEPRDTTGAAAFTGTPQGQRKKPFHGVLRGAAAACAHSPTIVVITDRTTRRSALRAVCGLPRLSAARAGAGRSREHLKELLDVRHQTEYSLRRCKSSRSSESHSVPRRNLIVMADEAHRSHYGLLEHVRKDGTGRSWHTARNNQRQPAGATFIVFTGTPDSSKDSNTKGIIRRVIDVYDKTQGGRYGATRPVYLREPRDELRTQRGRCCGRSTPLRAFGLKRRLERH